MAMANEVTSPEERLAEIQQKYDALAATQGVVRARLRNELEAKVDAETVEEREELSTLMHEAHAAGVSKDKLRVATRKHGNSAAFNRLWLASAPEESLDLRKRKRTAEPEVVQRDAEVSYVWTDEHDLVVTIGDDQYVLQALDGDYEAPEWTNFGDHVGDAAVYPVLLKAAAAALAELEEGEE